MKLKIDFTKKTNAELASPQKIKQNEKITTLLIILAIVLSAIVTSLYYIRLDITASKIFTLSNTTKNIYKEIPDQIRITYFVSKALTQRYPVTDEIADFLHNVASVSKNKISVKIVDPAKSDTNVEALGILAQQLQVIDKSEQRLTVVYSGISVEYLDRHESIPTVYSVESLEYELIKCIRAVVSNSHPIIGFLIGDNDKALTNDYQTLINTVSKAGYTIKEIKRGAAIDNSVNVLFVLGNNAITRFDACYIDNYIMHGGKVFFAVKGINIDADKGLLASALPDGGVFSILDSYGFVIDKKLVLDNYCLTVPFQTQNSNSNNEISYIKYPHWISIDARFTSHKNQITTNFNGLDLYWPSPINIVPKQEINYVELVKTTPEAWLQSKYFSTSPTDVDLYKAEQDKTSGQYLLAATASGIFPSAFLSQDIPTQYGQAAITQKQYIASSSQTRIVVVSSADFATDLMAMSQSSFNADFILSAADWLNASDDLASIRTKTNIDKRLNKITDVDTKKFIIALTYIVNVILIPIGIIIFAIIKITRRNIKTSYKA